MSLIKDIWVRTRGTEAEKMEFKEKKEKEKLEARLRKTNLFLPPDEHEDLTDKGTVAIVGSGPAALLGGMAARHAGYRKVVMLEKGENPPTGQKRDLTINEKHVHAYSTAFTRLLLKVPGFKEALLAYGGDVTYMGSPKTDVELGNRRLKTELTLETVTVDRTFIEYAMWQILNNMIEVEFIGSAQFQKIIVDSDNAARAISYKDKDGQVQVLEADHVITATGKSSRLLSDQYRRLRLKLPEPKSIQSDAVYSTIEVSMSPEQAERITIRGKTESPENPLAYGFTLQRKDPDIEGNSIYKVMIVRVGREELFKKAVPLREKISGFLKNMFKLKQETSRSVEDESTAEEEVDRDPRLLKNREEFLELLKMASEKAYNILRDVVPQDVEVENYKRTETVDKKVYEVEGVPENWSTMGDEPFYQNPRYGQGFMSAYLQAIEWLISQRLGEKTAGYMQRLKKLFNKLIQLPKGADGRFWWTKIMGDSYGFGTRTLSRIAIPALDKLSSLFPIPVAELFLAVTNQVPYEPLAPLRKRLKERAEKRLKQTE